MRGADGGRGKSKPFRVEPEVGKRTKDNVEASKSEDCHVLHENESRSHFANDPSELEPKAGTVPAADPLASAGAADVLARESARDVIHDATPRAAVEGGNVAPDRSRSQGLLFHPGHERGRGVGFPLDVTNRPGAGKGELDGDAEHPGAGEELDPMPGT